MENCGNSPKHIRIIWVDYDDMLRVDFPTVPGNAHTIKAVKPERNHSKFWFSKHHHSATRSIEARLQK